MSRSFVTYQHGRPATFLAAQVLKLGPLIAMRKGQHGLTYSDGHRGFSPGTIKKLVDRGEAVRVGNGVVHIDHIRTAIAAE